MAVSRRKNLDQPPYIYIYLHTSILLVGYSWIYIYDIYDYKHIHVYIFLYIMYYIHMYIEVSSPTWETAYRFVTLLGTTTLPRSLLRSAPVRFASIVAQVRGGGGIITFMFITNFYVGCRPVTFHVRHIIQQSSDRTSNTSQFPHAESCFCSNYLLGAMDLDHGLHCSAWDAAELLALVILCRFAGYRSLNPALDELWRCSGETRRLWMLLM